MFGLCVLLLVVRTITRSIHGLSWSYILTEISITALWKPGMKLHLLVDPNQQPQLIAPLTMSVSGSKHVWNGIAKVVQLLPAPNLVPKHCV